MLMLPREQRAERVQQVLAERNLNRHAAHNRLEISRPAMDKLWEGRDVELDIVEKFARGLGLSVNEWREHWGYPRVVDPTSTDGDTWLEDFEIHAYSGVKDWTLDARRRFAQEVERLVAERRRELGFE